MKQQIRKRLTYAKVTTVFYATSGSLPHPGAGSAPPRAGYAPAAPPGVTVPVAEVERQEARRDCSLIGWVDSLQAVDLVEGTVSSQDRVDPG